MSGGNISDGPNEVSGNVTDLQEKRKAAPPEVNEKRPPVRPVEQQLESLKERYDADHKRWLNDTNHMADKLKAVRDASQSAIDSMRKQLEKTNEELINARVKFDKYLMKNQQLQDRVDELEAKIDT